MEKAITALLGSILRLKPYKAIKGKARAERRHHIVTIMRELLVDQEAVVVEGGGGFYIRLAGHCDNEGPPIVRTIGVWATGRRMKLSIRQMLALLRGWTRRDLAEARTRLIPYCATTYDTLAPTWSSGVAQRQQHWKTNWKTSFSRSSR